MKNILTASLIGSVLLASASAMATGFVKVECWGDCNNVNLGQVCDTYSVNSNPTAVSCDDTADNGSGWDVACGGSTCRPWGTVFRSDPVGAYCQDGGGFDVVVACE